MIFLAVVVVVVMFQTTTTTKKNVFGWERGTKMIEIPRWISSIFWKKMTKNDQNMKLRNMATHDHITNQ